MWSAAMEGVFCFFGNTFSSCVRIRECVCIIHHSPVTQAAQSHSNNSSPISPLAASPQCLQWSAFWHTLGGCSGCRKQCSLCPRACSAAAPLHASLCVCMWLCMCVCVIVCVYLRACSAAAPLHASLWVRGCVCVCACTSVCVCVCLIVCLSVCARTHTSRNVQCDTCVHFHVYYVKICFK